MAGRVWTREKLVEEIKALGEQGVDLSPTAIQKTHGALFSSARSRSHFGTWRAAIEAAGLDYSTIKRIKQRWNRQTIVDQICVHHGNGEDLLHPDFKTRHRSLYLAACAHRYFGSWRRALLAAGLNHEQMRESRVWTKARIQRTIEELAAEGKPLGWASVEKLCPGIYRAARRRENFGSWNEALLAAGVVPPARRRGRRPANHSMTIGETVNKLTHISDNELDSPASPKFYSAPDSLGSSSAFKRSAVPKAHRDESHCKHD
jgi:hypothetical protein